MESHTPADAPRNIPRSMHKVTFCITELDPGGAEKALVRVANGLKQRGWNVNVVSLRNAGELSEELEQAGIRVTALNCGGLFDVRAVFRLRRALATHTPAILVCFLHQANLVGRLACLNRIPVVSGVRVADRRKLVVWPDRLTRGLTCKYIAVSHHVATVHSQLCRIPDHKMAVIHNGVETPDKFPTRGRRDNSDFRVLFVGRLTEQKRPQDLIAAISVLPAQLRHRIQVDIVGEGELRTDLMTRISMAELDEIIHLRGHQQDVGPWMEQADVLVLPSAWEGLPNVVLEAMAAGLPVIATNVDGTSEVIEHGETGWLVAPGDVQAIADCLARLAMDETRGQSAAMRAFEGVRQRFSWELTISAFDQLLSKVLNNGVEAENCR